MLLYENKKTRFLNYLRFGINPFKKFVATSEIRESIGLVSSRDKLLEVVEQILKMDKNVILPIIGSVGTGKTHLYWALKDKLIYDNIVYISLERVYRKFYYNTYSEYIEEMGVEALRSITNGLCDRWGALERKFGFFHVVDLEKVRKEAFDELSDKFEDQSAFIDSINAITAHQLDLEKKMDAEKWLLGELMDIKELSRLNLMNGLRNKNTAYTMLKILIENSKLGTIIFIDDFERLISILAPEEGDSEIYSSSWLYDDEDTLSPDAIAAQNLLDTILKLHEIENLKMIITLKTNDALVEIRKLVMEKGVRLLTLFKKPLVMYPFNKNDMIEFYKDNIELFLKNVNFLEFYDDFPDSLFPLNEQVLRFIYNTARGNPREIIKLLIKLFNDIIYTEESIENIIQNFLNA